jgi:hypothetical protein
MSQELKFLAVVAETLQQFFGKIAKTLFERPVNE